jgi:hypothetical protein
MIDERYSFSVFESHGVDSQAAEVLANQLATEVASLGIDAVALVLEEVVRRLNEMGHRLELIVPATVDADGCAAEIDYRDGGSYVSDGKPRLRIGVDLVISTGYAHLYDPDEEVDGDGVDEA